jgi:hypothetical protein
MLKTKKLTEETRMLRQQKKRTEQRLNKNYVSSKHPRDGQSQGR